MQSVQHTFRKPSEFILTEADFVASTLRTNTPEDCRKSKSSAASYLYQYGS